MNVHLACSVMFSQVLHYILYPLNILAQGGIHCISIALHKLVFSPSLHTPFRFHMDRFVSLRELVDPISRFILQAASDSNLSHHIRASDSITGIRSLTVLHPFSMGILPFASGVVQIQCVHPSEFHSANANACSRMLYDLPFDNRICFLIGDISVVLILFFFSSPVIYCLSCVRSSHNIIIRPHQKIRWG